MVASTLSFLYLFFIPIFCTLSLHQYILIPFAIPFKAMTMEAG
ncbi:hypothetical protein HMPREF9017_01534 [Parascardovia denticolens F0305]|nr:hypothetical protein HMPREF9017_01534 [Parascardovia denticolens F0305]